MGEDPDGTGICLSGGGIRSASYCLGALQSLACHGLLFGKNHARYLSAVSGGSYIATALTMVTKGRIGGGPSKADPTITPVRDVQADHPDMTPFAHGSPEERFLRDHTLYLTHGRAGIPGVVWRVLLGLTFNVLIVVLGLASIFLPFGWLYSWLWPTLRAGCPKRCPVGPMFSIPNGLWLAIISVSILAFLTGFVWLVWRFPHRVDADFLRRDLGILGLVHSSVALLRRDPVRDPLGPALLLTDRRPTDGSHHKGHHERRGFSWAGRPRRGMDRGGVASSPRQMRSKVTQ